MPVSRAILIVDDDPDVHRLLATVLSADHLHIDSAYDGLTGLARLQAMPYDLVLTDVRMPGLDGLALLRRIREVRPETKVMVMTAESTPANIITAIREQAFSYFKKPFSPDSVAEMVARALETPIWQHDIEILSARPEWVSLQLRCKLETADRLLQFLREMETDLPAQDREDIATAFRELLLNAIEHGGHSDPSKKVYVACIRTGRTILYYIRDPGEGFSLDNLPHAAISNPPDSPFEHAGVRSQMGIRPGGFGILLSRNFVDELIYNEKGNEVLLIKHVP